MTTSSVSLLVRWESLSTAIDTLKELTNADTELTYEQTAELYDEYNRLAKEFDDLLMETGKYVNANKKKHDE